MAAAVGSGGAGIMGLAAGLAVLRVLCLLAAAVLLASGFLLGMVVDFSLPTGMVAVAAEIPSRNLRNAASLMGLIFMIVSVAWVLLILAVWPSGATGALGLPSPRPQATSGSGNGFAGAALLVPLFVFAAQFVYTFFPSGMYAAGRGAVLDAEQARR